MLVILFFMLVLGLAFFVSKQMPKIKLPPLLAMLFIGILVSPWLNDIFDTPFALDDSILEYSSVFRTFALAIILWRAGLGISPNNLKGMGTFVFHLAFWPCLIEGVVAATLCHYLLDWSWSYSFCAGFVLSAISPAVIVPTMLKLKEKFSKTPTVILAACSLDDIFSVTFFAVALEFLLNDDASLSTLWLLPVHIVLGFAIGILLAKGQALLRLQHGLWLVPIVILSLVALFFEKHLPFSVLCLIMAWGISLQKFLPKVATSYAIQLKRVWGVGEVVLFVLIGSQLNIDFSSNTLLLLLVLCVGILCRSLTVWIVTIKQTKSTRIFTIFSFLPKATVQAAIGGVVLGLSPEFTNQAIGRDILNLAVFSILIAAPLGAVLLHHFGEKLLSSNES